MGYLDSGKYNTFFDSVALVECRRLCQRRLTEVKAMTPWAITHVEYLRYDADADLDETPWVKFS